jgi:Domain of unknown function (DUF4328)
MTNDLTNDKYVSLKGIAYLPKVGFWGLLFCLVAYFFLSLTNLVVVLPEVNYLGQGNMSIAFAIINVMSSIETLIRIFTIVTFLIWLYKAFKNLSYLGAENTEFTPGWAVGWWFIPIASLFKPYQAVCELWYNSDSDVEPNTLFSKSVGAPSFIGYWWGFFIVGNITGRLTDLFSGSSPLFTTLIFMLYCVLQIVAGILILKIVIGVTNQQDIRHSKVSMVENLFQKPPPPPTFNN